MKYCKSTGLSIPAELMQKIDAERGDISRSRFVLRLIERAYQQKQLIEVEK
jgi:metal-responsive CopG/Arc/MetJ family transcriptional regulator